MATKLVPGSPASTKGVVRRRQSVRRSRLLLPIVLGCCIAVVRGTIEEMMIAPIEVIEEWGCYDTEIRLTCGSLESKIAILEARFTPRCQDRRNCVYMDENSVTHPFASQKVDKLILEETEAGRRFLATLRRNHEKEMEATAAGGADVAAALAAARADESAVANGDTVVVAARSLAKDKRSSLRATLEHLIVRYLRRLTSDDDDEAGQEGNEEAARYRRQSPPVAPSRNESALTVVGLPGTAEVEDSAGVAGTVPISSSMEITLLTNDTDTNLTESWDGPERLQRDQLKDPGNGYGFSGSSVSGPAAWQDGSVELADDGGAPGGSVGGGASEKRDHEDASVFRGTSNDHHGGADVSATRDKLRDGGAGMPSGARSESHGEGEESEGLVRPPGSGGGLRRQQQKQKPKQKECGSVRKRVSQLDRFELERSMRNGSFREYNIRNALNYRCSGKNHCSFVFAQDHPFAVVWKEGTVRIKYICMEDFRISKYCDGQLIVGNEVHWESLDGDEEDDGDGDGDDQQEQDQYSANGGPAPSWQQPKDPPLDVGDANGAANDARSPDDSEEMETADLSTGNAGEDLREASASVVREALERGYGGDHYRRQSRAGEPHAEALQAATVHSFHNLKIFKPIDEPEHQHQQQQQKQQQNHHHPHQQQQNETDERNPETESTRNRNRQRAKVFSQDFRVLKILPSNLDVVEDIKQIGNEYYFKKDVEIVVDDRENEIVDGRGPLAVDAELEQRTVNYSTGTTSDGSELTETLDIVVLPAPTKDVEIYDSEALPTEAATPRSDAGDINVIGLITPTRTATTAFVNSSAPMAVDVVVTAEPSLASPEGAGVETTLGHWDEDRMDLPEQQGAMGNRTGGTVADPVTDDVAPFSFNNRTFQTIQDTVRQQELDESQGPYPPVGNYDDEDDDDDDDDDDDEEGNDAERTEEFDGNVDTDNNDGSRERGYGYASTNHGFDDFGSDKPHKKYISVQRTQLKHPLRQGFLMTPSYPKYYIGDSVCRWTLHAGLHQRIKLTVLDLALRNDDECRDYLQVVDLNTNHTLFRSCTESSRLIEIVSIQERLEVSVRTTTKVIYPKRGVLIHYTALGCEVPSPAPGHMRLVRRTEHRAKYVCDPLFVFPDTGESSRELICTAKHTWNRPLPACVEKRATEGSGLVSHYEQTRRFGDIDSMSDKQADTVYDILIPSFIIAGLFIVNGIVFAVIMRYRNKRKQRLDLESKELAEL